MKKLLAIILCTIILISSAACTKRSNDNDTTITSIPSNDNENHTPIDDKYSRLDPSEHKNEESSDSATSNNKETSNNQKEEPILNSQLDINTDSYYIVHPNDSGIKNMFDDSGYVQIKTGQKWGCMNKSGAIIIEPQFDYVSKFKNGLAQVIKDGKHGYIDVQGKYIVEPKYDKSSDFVNGVAYVGTNIKYNFYNYAIIDTTGRVLLEGLDDIVSIARAPNIIIFKSNGKTGAFVRDSKTVISAEYDEISSDTGDENLLLSTKDGKQGYINIKGGIVLPAIHNTVWGLKNETALYIDKNGKIGVINTTGNIIVSAQYDTAERLNNGFIKVMYNNKYGILDNAGKVLVEPMYYRIYGFSEGLCLVQGDNGYGYIDETGKEIIKQKFKEAHAFSNNLAAVKTKDKWGYIDKKGEIIIKEKFDEACHFENDRAIVAEEKHFFIDKTGKKSTPTVPVNITFGGYYGLLGTDGKVIEDCIYKKIFVLSMDRALVFNGNKWGYVNSNGKLVIECQYRWASEFSRDGYAIVQKSGIMYNIIDVNGNIIGDEFLDSPLLSTCHEKGCTNRAIKNPTCYEHTPIN